MITQLTTQKTTNHTYINHQIHSSTQTALPLYPQQPQTPPKMAYLQATSLIGKFSIFLLLCIAQTSFSSPIQTLCGRRLLTTTTPSDIVKQYLPPHNKARAKLGLPPLKWSNKLTNYASWWGHQRQVNRDRFKI